MGSKLSLALCALAVFVFCNALHAQQKYNGTIPWGPKGFHGISVWGSLGYSRLSAKLAATVPLGYAGGSAGVGYSFAFNPSWSVNAGVELARLSSSTKAYTFDDSQEREDSEGMTFTMQYRYHRYKEYQHAHYLNLPLSLGYTYQKFYALAGAKVGLQLQSSYRVKINPLETSGSYPQFIGDFEDMPNHYFSSKPREEKGSITLGANLMASVEAGVNLVQREQKNIWRLALFCDYGLINIHSGASSKNLIEYDNNNPLNIHANSLLYSNQNKGESIKSLMVGVKVTRLLIGKPISRRYRCNCLL